MYNARHFLVHHFAFKHMMLSCFDAKYNNGVENFRRHIWRVQILDQPRRYRHPAPGKQCFMADVRVCNKNSCFGGCMQQKFMFCLNCMGNRHPPYLQNCIMASCRTPIAITFIASRFMRTIVVCTRVFNISFLFDFLL